ncbi:MAG: calcium/sodium antiporter [Candidatus Altiarchaeota archaeon]
MVFVELFTLVIFTVILARSSSVVVDNAITLATHFGVSQLAIGILLVAVSTSLPELSVSVSSSVAKEGAIAAGNVFGSNIANILLILGIGAYSFGFRVDRESLKDIALILLLTTIISVYIIIHSQMWGNALGFLEGLVLLIIAILYASHMLHHKSRGAFDEGPHVSRRIAFRSFLLFFAGIVAVIISSSLVVDSAVKLANLLGLSKSFIGATLIAVGTSLPELTVDLQAIRKRHYSLALGDAIGSNMVNITLVLGAAALISPITVNLQIFNAALLFAVVANMLFFYIAVVKRQFDRRSGMIMLATYAFYLILIFGLQSSELLPA